MVQANSQSIFKGDAETLNREKFLTTIPSMKVWDEFGKEYTLDKYLNDNKSNGGKPILIYLWGTGAKSSYTLLNQIDSANLVNSYTIVPICVSSAKTSEEISSFLRKEFSKIADGHRWNKMLSLASTWDEINNHLYTAVFPFEIIADAKMNIKIASDGISSLSSIIQTLNLVQENKIQKGNYWYNKKAEITSSDNKDAYYYQKYLVQGTTVQKILGTKDKVLSTSNYIYKNKEYLYNGSWSGFFEDGKKILEGNFKDGKPITTYQQWYANGKTQWIYPVNGTMKIFDEKENVIEEGNIESGLGNGIFTTYKEGKKTNTTPYLNGDIYGLFTWYDDNGSIIKEAYKSKEYSSYSNLVEGLQVVSVNGLYGYIDKTGTLVIPPKYTIAEDFKDGKAKVRINNTSYFINKKGLVITYDEVVKEFIPGILLVRKFPNYGLVNKNTDEVLLPVEYTLIGDFVEDMAMVITKNGDIYKRGFIDKSCKLVIPLKYKCAKDFSEGLAAVCVDGIWGYIDKKGNEVIPLKYKSAYSFKNGEAEVYIEFGSSSIKINKKGERI